MALEERFARRLRENCDDVAGAARRFEVKSVAVHQYVHDEVTGEVLPLVLLNGSAPARQLGFLGRASRALGCSVHSRGGPPPRGSYSFIT